MYELDDDGKIGFCHNPFSMPKGGLKALEEQDPLLVDAYQYDLVCNGYELASGAVRNHEIDVMKKLLKLLDILQMKLKKGLGHYIMHFNLALHHMLAVLQE